MELTPAQSPGPTRAATYGPRPTYAIESVDNALRLLQEVCARGTLRASEAGEHLAVARSTAHRLLAMLQYRGFIAQDPASREYLPGPTLVELGLSQVHKMDIRTAARPFMERVASEVEETVHLVTLQGDHVVFLDSVESGRALRVVSRTGLTLPAHSTSVGKALLAALSDEEVIALYPRERLETVTARTLNSRTSLLAQLRSVRRDGYALSQGESEDGVGSIGVAVVDDKGRTRGAMSAAVPLARFGPEQRKVIARCLRIAAEEMGRSLP